jgi:ABC-type microcin C transport system duplicated ATPase subunit YejF
MAVRLGFSIAVHTEPEILLVDEVLAVGDAPFQKKCIERIDQMRQNGVSILFVSHDLDSIRSLSDRVFWLNEGDIVADGDPDTVVRRYTQHFYEESIAAGMGNRGSANGTGDVVIEQVHLLNDEGTHRDYFVTGEPLVVELHYSASQRVEQPVFGLHFHRTDGALVAGPDTQTAGLEMSHIEGTGTVRYTIPTLSLLEGTYYLSVFARDVRRTCTFDHHEQRYPFRVLNLKGEQEGYVSLLGAWEHD